MTGLISTVDTTRFMPIVGTAVAPKAELIDVHRSSSPTDPAVSVELSKPARTLAHGIRDLPPLELDPAKHMQNAQKALKALKSELGIPNDTPIDIRLSPYGTFTVTADHPAAQELEDRLNDGRAKDLRNALIGAQNGTLLQNIAGIVSDAAKKADRNAAMTDHYYDQARALIDQTMAMDFHIRSEGDRLTGTLVDATDISSTA